MPEFEGRDRAGRTALHYAANSNGREIDELRSLVAQGFDVNEAEDKGWRPLHFAAQNASVETLDILYDAGAELEAENAKGDTPLGVASASPHSTPAVLQWFRNHGANPHHENRLGRSAVSRLASYSNLPDKKAIFADLMDGNGEPTPQSLDQPE